MTNRNVAVGSSVGGDVKKPRLKLVQIAFDGTPNKGGGLNNGLRPHGGNRGTKQFPPSLYSFNKDPEYQKVIQTELKEAIAQEYFLQNGSPYWAADTTKEITHSGESPLFVHKLLASSKYEQEHGEIKFHRALLQSPSSVSSGRRSAPPSRNKKMYYRPNRTHQYLSATELSDISANEPVLKFGRPTRTTLLRARQRSNSAPVNAYDVRRELIRRAEEVKHNSIFYASKEAFEREQTRISYRLYNIYTTDGETMHSFLTGARYNRAHLIDSKGLSLYGLYMPRHNPQNCFVTGSTRLKDHGEDIPSAPPDSPRSDTEDVPTLINQAGPGTSRPQSSRPLSSRPASSRQAATRKSTPRTPGSRPRSAWGENTVSTTTVQLNLSGPDSSKGYDARKEQMMEEMTINPDHLNIKGKGVYVTIKGQRMAEILDSTLPSVHGISVPKIHKTRDAVEETRMINQPPPTPIDVSYGGETDRAVVDRHSTPEPAEHVAVQQVSGPASQENGGEKEIQKEHVRREGSAKSKSTKDGEAGTVRFKETENEKTKQEHKVTDQNEIKIEGEHIKTVVPDDSGEDVRGQQDDIKLQEVQGEFDDEKAKGEAIKIVIPAEIRDSQEINEEMRGSSEMGSARAPVKSNDNLQFFITEEGTAENCGELDKSDKKQSQTELSDIKDTKQEESGNMEEISPNTQDKIPDGEEERGETSDNIIGENNKGKANMGQGNNVDKESSDTNRITSEDLPFVQQTDNQETVEEENRE